MSPSHPARRRRTAVTLVSAAALLAGGLTTASVAAAEAPGLLITEIAPDNASYDDFEFIEVTNTTGAPLDLATVSLAYTYVDSADSARDVPLTVPEDTVLDAGETAVLWLSYTTGTVDSFVRTEQEFRDFWADAGADTSDYRLVRVTGQSGMANGGDRGIRSTSEDGSSTWSFYPAGSTAIDATAHFRVDETASRTSLLAGAATPSPGQIDPAALVPPVPEPDPDPDPEPEPEPAPDPDPTLVTSPLQVTEVTPDTTNVGSADGYEFIEVYNATTEPIDFADYKLDYLYPAEDLTNNNVVQWPSVPETFLIQPADTAVFWIKNGQNNDLTAADFNAQFGVNLTAGEDLVEIHTGGMANGSPRGLQVVTNTGFGVNKAYYNLAGVDDVSANVGIQYQQDPADQQRQILLGHEPATPGSVTATQVPAGLMIPPADTTAPTVDDHTTDAVDPAQDFTVAFTITDDVQVRTASLSVQTSGMTEPTVRNLLAGPEDRYEFSINQVDLTGARWVDYTLTTSDGTHSTSTATVRVPVTGVDTSPVRLNLDEGQFLSGTTRVSAGGDVYPSQTTLSVDGQSVEGAGAALESQPVFAFEATSTDAFFRNGVLIGDDVLHIFDEGFYATEVTVATEVPLSYVTQGEDLALSVYAGTKAWPKIDLDENNDDFQIRNLRLVLPDGRTLRAPGFEDPAAWIAMGDSAGKNDFVDAAFGLPDDAFSATAFDWDTTAATDGAHTVTATDGATTVSHTVQVDNTAPAISTTIEDGADYQGEFVIDASAQDAGSGADVLSATLDGAAIDLPHTASSLELAAGEHVLALSARDAVGNTATRTVTFTTPVEAPDTELLSPEDGATIRGTKDVDLIARVSDPSSDLLDVSFLVGQSYTTDDAALLAWSGETTDAAEVERAERVSATATERTAMATDDGQSATTSSDDALPYQLFEVPVQDSDPQARVRVAWEGSANAEATVLLSVHNTETGEWEEVDRVLTTDDQTEIALEALVPATDHVQDGAVQVLVQHSEGFAHTDLSDRDTPVEPAHPEDVARSDYDFTLAWESDTQYYNESFPQRQLDIHDYLLDRRDELNLAYLFHTGDIVDDFDQDYQWANADPAYELLDDAQLPYGVLAGNHDVGHALEDYSAYGEFFGDARFADNPWFGGSYENNRGHYDLVTVGGVDFLMVYLGWGPSEEGIAWMNEVLAAHPDRTAIINLHEYMLTTGGLGPIPQQIQDEVVATNPNVSMVFSGHYHDAFTRVDEFDDTGDGVPDRTVTQMLFDYQGLPEGGQSFLRLLHFDNEGERMLVRTYSPYLEQYNSEDPSLDLEHQEFEVSYAQLGIEPKTKTLATDSVTVDVLGSTVLQEFEAVPSGTTVTAELTKLHKGDHSWFVRTEDPHGAVDHSEVREFNLHPGKGKGIDNGKGRGNGQG